MNNLIRSVIAALILLLSLTALYAQDAISGTPDEICAASPAQEPASREYAQPEQVLQDGMDYRAIFCTDAGAIYVDLLESYAPVTVNSFVFLAQNHYYDNTIFHRVIADFMAQGGDPTATGSGGPGYQFEDEFAGFLVFDRPGLLAMANAGPGTNGSQFFITTAPTPHLNFAHTIFGSVLEGQNAVAAIQLRDPAVTDAPATSIQTVVIISDPASISSEYVNPLAAADSSTFLTGLEAVGAEDFLPPDLVAGYTAPALTSTADLSASIPAAAQEAVAALLTDAGHQFRVAVGIDNTACSTDYFFENLRYVVDSYGSAQQASAVLANEALTAWNAADGYTLSESATVPLYVSETPGCNETNATSGRIHLQRGRYVVTVEGRFSAEVIAQVGEDALAQVLSNNIPQLFEPFITDAFRAELP